MSLVFLETSKSPWPLRCGGLGVGKAHGPFFENGTRRVVCFSYPHGAGQNVQGGPVLGSTKEPHLELTPIGHFICAEDAPALAPRQGALFPHRKGQVQLVPYLNPLCLRDLEGFERIWLLFQFDRATKWNPLVLPPHETRRRGVFATRSPYRPNAIGLTAVALTKVVGHTLHVTGGDLLNQTPILDIKPYLPFADSFPTSVAGWVDKREKDNPPHQVVFSPGARERLAFLEEITGKQLFQLVADQLGRSPTLGKAKRIKPQGGEGGHWVFSWRRWRIGFRVEGLVVHVASVESGLGESNQPPGPESMGDDEKTHRLFQHRFPHAILHS